MANKDEKKVDQASGGAKVRWDDSKMKSTYANVCNVASTREEVTLLFGTNQTWHSGGKEVTVELSDRIILNPYAAKRLTALLNAVVKQYEEHFGVIDIAAGDLNDDMTSHSAGPKLLPDAFRILCTSSRSSSVTPA